MKWILSLMFLVIFSFSGFSLSIDNVKYVDGAKFPVIGRGFDDIEARYDRLPARLNGKTRTPVWQLSKNCSGLALRFRTNSTKIAARWEVSGDVFMNHFTMTGIKGLDLYCLKDGKWQFVNSGRPTAKLTEAMIVQNMEGESLEYMLYLPLYDGLERLEIGVDTDAVIKGPQVNSPVRENPVVVYGTSITQGGCASRAGMSYTSILSRKLNREFINLGFSGNGQLDLEVAEAMADISASCFVIDCLPNVNVEQMNQKYEKFLKIIRDKNPKTPIIVVESILFPHMYFDKNVYALIKKKNETLKNIFHERRDKGDKNIYYVKADKLVGTDGETSVDGIHLTDLGFKRMAEYLYPIIKKRIK